MSNISPRVDIVFKKIFGVEENKDLLISLINSIVSAEDQVVDITLLNPYNLQNFYNDKLSILDIKAKSHNGKMFNVEIQITDHADYDKRALYYWSKLYTEQLKESKDYCSLSKTIGIHILNFFAIPEFKSYHNVFHVTEKETGVKYFNDLELHTIELKKFTENRQGGQEDFLSKVKTALDMWVAFLTRHDLLNKTILPEVLNAPNIEKALKILDYMHFTEQERDTYENHLKWLRDESAALKRSEEKGMERGMERGMEKGMEKGREEGVLGVARAMLAEGVAIKDIIKFTKLTTKQIEMLK